MNYERATRCKHCGKVWKSKKGEEANVVCEECGSHEWHETVTGTWDKGKFTLSPWQKEQDRIRIEAERIAQTEAKMDAL
ncbi:hypothetical protein KAR91_53785 [Candidatus Pacearchaeota archaeon]|nr:hypothetical protein [Candidatus Pacearchaeota archaeon]